MWLMCVLCLVLQLPFFDPCLYLQPKFIIWFYHIHRQWGAIEWVCLVTKQMPETDKSFSQVMVLINVCSMIQAWRLSSYLKSQYMCRHVYTTFHYFCHSCMTFRKLLFPLAGLKAKLRMSENKAQRMVPQQTNRKTSINYKM